MHGNPPRRVERTPSRHKTCLAPLVVFLSACSLTATDAPPPAPPTSTPHILYRVAEAPVEPSTLTLLPRRIGAQVAAGGSDEVRVYLGGLSTFRGSSADPFNKLAIVLLAARDSAAPLLQEHRQVVLDMDGRLFMTHPEPDPRLYTYQKTGFGYTETVFIPMSREMLRRLAGAETVRGRLGHWITFELTSRCLQRLADLHEALPEGFSFGGGSAETDGLRHITF